MAWNRKSGATFSGGSGQMAVMVELLHRQCNAAIPLVDVGTDVFVFRDDREDVARIQVKAARGQPYKRESGYHTKFGVPMDQLRRTDAPPLFYALAIRLDAGWGPFVVISRTDLQTLWNDGLGSENQKSGDLELYIRFRPVGREGELGGVPAKTAGMPSALCGTFDLTRYVNAWESLPPLKPPVTIA